MVTLSAIKNKIFPFRNYISYPITIFQVENPSSRFGYIEEISIKGFEVIQKYYLANSFESTPIIFPFSTLLSTKNISKSVIIYSPPALENTNISPGFENHHIHYMCYHLFCNIISIIIFYSSPSIIKVNLDLFINYTVKVKVHRSCPLIPRNLTTLVPSYHIHAHSVSLEKLEILPIDLFDERLVIHCM